jgi:acyl-CoA thioesterase FadM
MTMATSNDFSTDVEVRFVDLDAYGHVNSATYFTYLETARTKLIGFSAALKTASFSPR